MLDIRQGGNTILRRKIFVFQCRKTSYGNHFVQCFRNFPGAKKFMDKGGGVYQDFPSKTISLTVPKIFPGESFTASLISSLEKC